jgi:hypothetical protein
MKKKPVVRFGLNLMWYLLIAAALLFLYSPYNHHPKNQMGSSSQFVYQQF